MNGIKPDEHIWTHHFLFPMCFFLLIFQQIYIAMRGDGKEKWLEQFDQRLVRGGDPITYAGRHKHDRRDA